jgi:hypothetical protein
MSVHRIDFNFREWLGDTATLDAVEIGILISACALMAAHGGSVEIAELRRFVRCHGRTFNRAIARLIAAGKVEQTGSQIAAKWVETALKHARNRVETWEKNGRKGGRPSNKTNGLAKPSGSYARATKQYNTKQERTPNGVLETPDGVSGAPYGAPRARARARNRRLSPMEGIMKGFADALAERGEFGDGGDNWPPAAALLGDRRAACDAPLDSRRLAR